MNKNFSRVMACAMALSLLLGCTVSAKGTSGKSSPPRKAYLPSTMKNVDSDNYVSDVGYILVGESHISMSEQSVWDNARVQVTDKDGDLEMGKNIFFVHTLHQYDYQVEMHYGSSSIAYERLTDKPVNFNGAYPDWLTTDDYTSPSGTTTTLSAASRIKQIQSSSPLKKWVVVIIQGYTAANGGESAYAAYMNTIQEFAKSLQNTTTYVVSCPLPNNQTFATNIKAYNTYLRKNLQGVGCYDWTEDWVKYGFDTQNGTLAPENQNHLPHAAYYEIWKQHLGNELRYGGVTVKDEEIPEEPKQDGPSYAFREENVNLNLGLSKSYKIAWISDLHIVSNYNNLDDVVKGNIGMNASDYIAARYNMFKTDDGLFHSAELLDEIVKYINTGGFDAVIFGGDLLDYFSNENYKTLSRGLSNIDSSIPWIYIYGSSDDHDAWTGLTGGSAAISSISKLASAKAPNDVIDLGELRIVGLNNSANAGINAELSSVQSSIKTAGKPVILATHVPFESKVSSLEDWSKRNHNNQVYYWSFNSYKWKLGNNSAMNSFLNENVYSNNTNVKAVFAGHVHMASWDGQLTANVKQHIFTGAYRGTIGVINVH